MELFFKTRDLGPKCDYPAIGWMPTLHDDDHLPWIRFKDFGSVEHPQIVVSGHGDRWSVYLESLDSGRTDSPSGVGGRVIRMSLYVTGGKEEGHKVSGLIARYVRDVLRDGREDTLKSVFAACIKPGDPFHWKQDGETVQKLAADRLLQCLIAATENIDSFRAGNTISGTGAWAAGMSHENAEIFIGVCRELLIGSRQGTAVALSKMQLSNVDWIMALSDSGLPLIAVLSLSQDDRGIPIRNIDGGKQGNTQNNQRGVTFDPERGSSDGERDSKPIGRYFFVGGLVIGAAIFILSLVKGCVFDRGRSGMFRQQPVNGEGGR